ncbi:MAG: type II toxin-antitoxin system RelE/ParE family toxin [Actinobacteria bacterium]|nr:MAG: type II toxin-antitoxin system RelE/ParE family toxin [Actinomycetota bacterium]
MHRRWRDYRTAGGARPVSDYILALPDRDRAAIAVAMRAVVTEGRRVARHLRGPIYELRADGVDESYRVLFAAEGKKSRILLALEAISKRTQHTPKHVLDLAERRLADWRRRA